MSGARKGSRTVAQRARGFAPGTLLTELPATALRILGASRRILERDGFAGLTYEAIATESGEYKDSVRYHFGGKAGLIAALVDSSVHDASLGIYAEARDEPDPRRRLPAVIDASRELTKGDDTWATWELLPHVLRDDGLRPRVAELYESYREHYVEVLDAGDDRERAVRARDYACIVLAVLDGLALQKALDPGGVALERVFDLWLAVVTGSLGAVIPDDLPNGG